MVCVACACNSCASETKRWKDVYREGIRVMADNWGIMRESRRLEKLCVLWGEHGGRERELMCARLKDMRVRAWVCVYICLRIKERKRERKREREQLDNYFKIDVKTIWCHDFSTKSRQHSSSNKIPSFSHLLSLSLPLSLSLSHPLSHSHSHDNLLKLCFCIISPGVFYCWRYYFKGMGVSKPKS